MTLFIPFFKLNDYIEQVIENVSEEKQKSINWTDVWGKKYAVLTI